MNAVTTQDRIESPWRRLLDNPTPIVKQLPTIVAALIALILVAFIPELGFSDLTATVVGSALIAAATVYAIVLSVRGDLDGIAVLIIPMIDIVGLGGIRAGTGGAQSLFGSLVLLPVIWLAAAPGIRYVVLVAVLSSVAVLTPYFLEPPVRAVDWLRGVISPLVFAAVAAVVNELSRQQRLRADLAERLVTERTEALAENVEMVASLRESERQYRALLDSFESLWASITAQAVIATDDRGIIVAWNPGAERLLGLSSREALDDVCIDRFFSEDVLRVIADELPETDRDAPSEVHPGLRALFARAAAEIPLDGDIQVTTAGSSTVPARVTVTRRQGSKNQPEGYIFVVTDETRAVEVARMKDEFVGMISHELRTPLSAIIGFLDLLRNDPAQPLTTDQAEFADIIERNAQRLLNLVGDLLFTAQAESGRFSITKQEIDLRDCARASVVSAGPHAEREGVELSVEIPEQPVRMLADAGRIGQALDNLLSNAIKFTPAGGNVLVRVQHADGVVILAVRDTGLGIPKDEQRMLFTRFFRASTATRNAVPGIGLGLVITRAIVMAHEGTMDFTSTEGEGTEFRMLFPNAPRTEALQQLTTD
ncbi:sensor histidine kinase [Microbacterium murale]|uniref:histidine kinase n=1 Tax=Microbacterium murale TaxID=1081040 RepID=A0ABQ1RLQ1_9MICO|nr:PAS domain-containing sensor histidine kinase [Microbacterium murale]GGD74758.1 two-component sensor histidine kinase [Microbacterium murale]